MPSGQSAPGPPTARGGATPSSTRSTCGASPTRTATGSAIWPASGPAAVPARAGRRRALVQPLVPLAPRGYGLRHLGLPLDRSGVRDARGSRAADRGGARARDPHDRRHRPEPRLERASLVQGGDRLGAGIERALALLVPSRAPVRTASSLRTAGSRSSAGPPGRGRSMRTASPPTGICTSSPPSSPTSTGRTRTSGRSTRTFCGSGSTGALRASGSTRPRFS